jgi:hypothetical protein
MYGTVSAAPLATRLEQADAGGNGHVETFHAAVHRNARQFVAGFARQAAHAVALGPEYPGAGTFLVDGIEFAFGLTCGTDDPDAALLNLAQTARKIRHHDVRHRVGGAAGDLDDCGVETAGLVLGRHHRMRSGRIGDAQTGAEVVRIGDAVEHQQQGRLAQTFQHIVQRYMFCLRGDLRHHALMLSAAGQSVEPFRIGQDDAHPVSLRQFQQVAHAAVLAAFGDSNFPDVVSGMAQLGGDGMEAMDQPGIGTGVSHCQIL